MPDDANIVTHSDPVARDRCNYILHLDLAQDGLTGKYEQVWARTDDQQVFELCCIPFFAYGLSLGDTFKVTTAEGAYEVVSKGGNKTVRFAIQDQRFAHERHREFHADLARTGVSMEFSGHANGYGALSCSTQDQVDAVLGVLVPLMRDGTLLWEWADPVAAH